MKFTIKEGRHYSEPSHIRVHFGVSKIKFKFKFSKECVYPMDDVRIDADDYDINKLHGFSQGHHHWNASARLGWIPSVNQVGRIELYRYCYNKGKRIPDYIPIVTVDVEKWYEAEIELNDLFQTATFKIWDTESGLSLCTASTAYKRPAFKWGYKLDPHFGGDHVSPHDMAIWIEELSAD